MGYFNWMGFSTRPGHHVHLFAAFRTQTYRFGQKKIYIYFLSLNLYSTADLLPSRVTHLTIKKPPNFYFHPGDYVFVQIPSLANYEWHPFTISSAPELPGCLF